MSNIKLRPSKITQKLPSFSSFYPSELNLNSTLRHGASLSTEATLRNMKKVIFPNNKWIKRWDTLVLMLLTYLVFVLPYQLGVSLGVYLVEEPAWFAFNFIIDIVFLIDTFLYFWRAYLGENNRLVFNLSKIRSHYLRTYFVPNLISNFPSNLILFIMYQTASPSERANSNGLMVIKILDLLKLCRIIRLKTILESSQVITELRQSMNSQLLNLVRYSLVLLVVAHWFACIWSAVALYQVELHAQSHFRKEDFTSYPNWMGNWYDGNYIEGGLNPFGKYNDIDRYVLSLFWAIQTITSIGYGNIAPVTRVEWWISSMLMLLSGILWAYLIGGLVGVVAAMQVQSELYGSRNDEANKLIKSFEAEDDEHTEAGHIIGQRIKKYIHDQNFRSDCVGFSSNLEQRFPVLETLSPQLQCMSSYLLLKNDLERVPYLSSRFLSVNEQAAVAMECQMLEFAPGELIDIERTGTNLGRGVLIFKSGLGYGFDYHTVSHFVSTTLTAQSVFGASKVLMEDGHPASKGRLKCLTFTHAIFIPREAILRALDTNRRAWKESARWAYTRLALLSGAAVRKERKSLPIVQNNLKECTFQEPQAIESERVEEVVSDGILSELSGNEHKQTQLELVPLSNIQKGENEATGKEH